MNKRELAALVSEKAGLSKADALRAVDATFEAITEALRKNDDVRLVGFGTYTVSTRAAHEGRNPRTGESITIPASKHPRFKPKRSLVAELSGPHGTGGGSDRKEQ